MADTAPTKVEEEKPKPAEQAASSAAVSSFSNVLIGVSIGLVVAIGVGIAVAVTTTLGAIGMASGVLSDGVDVGKATANTVGTAVSATASAVKGSETSRSIPTNLEITSVTPTRRIKSSRKPTIVTIQGPNYALTRNTKICKTWARRRDGKFELVAKRFPKSRSSTTQLVLPKGHSPPSNFVYVAPWKKLYPPQKRASLTDGSRVCELIGEESKNDTIDFYKSMSPVLGVASTWLKSQKPFTDESDGKEGTEGDDMTSPRGIAGETSPHSFDHLSKMVSDAMPKELMEAKGDDFQKILTDAMPVLKEKATEFLDKVDKEKNPLAAMAAEFLRSMDKDKETDNKGERGVNDGSDWSNMVAKAQEMAAKHGGKEHMDKVQSMLNDVNNVSNGTDGLDLSKMAAKAQEMAANHGAKEHMDKVETMFTDLRTKVDQVRQHSSSIKSKFDEVE